MKIQCSNCGKKFDLQKHMYICPACGTYNEVKKYDNWLGRELTPEEQAEYDAKYNREPMSYDRYPKDIIDVDRIAPVWLKKSDLYKNNPKIKYIWVGILMLVLMILAIVSAIYID